jgi:hypothetical protein
VRLDQITEETPLGVVRAVVDAHRRDHAPCPACGRRLGQARYVKFDGKTIDPDQDEVRLTGQLLRVFSHLGGGSWMTLGEISSLTGDPESSISARIRDLRKPRFGYNTVRSRRRSRGLWEYQLAPSGVPPVEGARY